MCPNPALLRELRDAIRQAAHDLDGVKLKRAEEAPELDRLRSELRASILKDHSRFAKEAQCLAARARDSLRNIPAIRHR